MTNPKPNMSILIAEDDNNIALALQTVISKAFDCRELNHTGDGQQAWQLLQQRNYDLIISDWNMPGMTGQELLDKIRHSDKHCNTPFLMLTARADKTSVLAAIQSGANDYISKPYKKDQLIEKLNKLLSLATQRENSIDALAAANSSKDEMQASQDIIQLILDRFKRGRVELPILPHVYTAVSEAIDKDDADITAIVKIIETEPAISAALITISNSSFYRGTTINKTLEQALTRIGLEATRHYVFMIEGRFLFKSEHKDYADIIHKLWEHSLATAICARAIAQRLKIGNMDILFSMGLLHDIGKLPLINILIELANTRTDINKDTFHCVLAELHTEIGAIMLSQWQFPEEIINIAKYHHDISSEDHRSIELLIVHLANILVRSLGFSLAHYGGNAFGEIESARLLHIDTPALQEILQNVQQEVDNIKDQF